MTTASDDLDVLIIGAGISGISAAWHVQRRCPGKRFAVLEARDSLGGTWDFFKYPGLRSDSDMHTLGFRFRPWTEEKAIAEAPAIMAYLRDTARESGIDRHIRYGSRVTGAAWSSEDQRWTVQVETGSGKHELTSRLLFFCGGYYRYDAGYTPDFPGMSDFAGTIAHPNQWPEDLDWAGKRVVVVGSGATAVTLVPVLARTAAHVVMLQRSPSYILPAPSRDKLAIALAKRLPPKTVHAVIRWRNILRGAYFYRLTRKDPAKARAMLRSFTVRALPEGYPVDTHFNPRYNPWDQRLCLAPGGDIYRAISDGRASVATGQIEAFTPTGLRLRGSDGNGSEEIEADIVVTATGFNMGSMTDLPLVVDGERVDLAKQFAYKTLMLTSVPNFVFTVGYTNASWTLKADLVSEYACRLLAYLDKRGLGSATPVLEAPIAEPRPLFGDFQPGYAKRASDTLPKQGPKAPWRQRMSYVRDVVEIRHGRIPTTSLRFSAARPTR
ncbi:MAG: flavin-containing monooxygenase [Segniliparus sp.]|uniref:flavin-containing monooxygenase n=1 Tax=Segniliparus sp. TaxID=2804064 RepID=UPI003F32C5F5